MEPFNEQGVLSSESVIYALEMHQEWFDKHNVKVGDKIIINRSSHK
jgi:uncharacterized membrane protein (UPF0127 family)